MEHIEISNCSDCPLCDGEGCYCGMSGVNDREDIHANLIGKGVPENCPLKTKNILVSYKQKE